VNSTVARQTPVVVERVMVASSGVLSRLSLPHCRRETGLMVKRAMAER
jgi:hypothetical protein